MSWLGRFAVIALAGAMLGSPAVRAQDLSSKPIKLIVGLAAGGATDVMAASSPRR